jgi:eukaryotic-like serine/threonine-protein kinase
LRSMASLVLEHSGCVVKTMRDGLITVFPSIQNAVMASTAIAKASLEWNLSVMQAMHQGPAVVATINDRLDYFGETPQMLEDLLASTIAGELRLTDSCLSEPGSMTTLKDSWEVTMEPSLSSWPKHPILVARPT